MTRILVVLICFLAVTITGQTLTQTYNEPKVGDYELKWNMDTSAYTTGMPISITGSNSVWNFTSLAAGQVVVANYLSPAAVPSSSGYVGCNTVQSDNGSYTFFKSVTSPSQQTEILGLDIGIGAVNLSNSGIVAKYPVSFGYNQTDPVAGAFTSTITNGTCSGNITTKADGTGTLNLPAGVSLTDVLRLKSELTITLTAFFFPVATAKQTIYSYYHSSKRFPILTIIYTEVTATGSSPSITAVVTGNYFVVQGLPENEGLSGQTATLFPNPVRNLLSIEVDEKFEGKEIEIYNGLSQLVYSGLFEKELSLNGLQSGVYNLHIKGQSGIIRKKFIKE